MAAKNWRKLSSLASLWDSLFFNKRRMRSDKFPQNALSLTSLSKTGFCSHFANFSACQPESKCPHMAVNSMPRVTNSNCFGEFGESMKPRAAPAIN
ncbi:MAG: hypothetical protein ACKO5X_02710, partial [Limnohabitans sp.]